MKNTKTDGTSSFALIDGLRIYNEVHGGAPADGNTPIVLLHGGVMSIDTAFAEDLPWVALWIGE